MRCQQCGHLNADQEFCVNCGTRLISGAGEGSSPENAGGTDQAQGKKPVNTEGADDGTEAVRVAEAGNESGSADTGAGSATASVSPATGAGTGSAAESVSAAETASSATEPVNVAGVSSGSVEESVSAAESVSEAETASGSVSATEPVNVAGVASGSVEESVSTTESISEVETAGGSGKAAESASTSGIAGGAAGAETPRAEPAGARESAGAKVFSSAGGPSAISKNEQVQRITEAGRQYWTYALQLLKNPAETACRTGGADFVNGLITFALYAITLPLILYITLLSVPFVRPRFFATVIQPTLFLFLFLICTSGMILLADRLGKGTASFKDIMARLGAFLVVPAALHVVALLTALIRLRPISMLALVLAFFGLIAAVSLTLTSFRRKEGRKLDVFYGILLTGLAMVVLTRIFGGGMVNWMLGSVDFPFFN